ncbi:MAG TPA: outer membrane beta-barrel protein [Bradyrhizobium sp.]|nr:outer membrane beta-barrel protein [Bradyrhizobium sp.]
MNKLLASASFLVLSSASVMAADLPMSYKSPAPAIVPTYTWTGCYLGVHGGGGAMNDSNSNSSNFEGSGNGNNAFHGTGGLAGGQAGCNYQMTNVVFGVEGEGYWSGMKGTLDRSRNFFTGSVLNETEFDQNTTSNKYDYTIAGRMGIAFDRTLVYGKAGWAWGRFDALSSSGFTDFPTGPTGLDTATWGGTLNGPLFGLGIEYLVTNNWTVKLEYNYIAFGTRSFATTSCSTFSNNVPPTTCVGNGQSSGNTPLGADKQIFKFGVNYKFDWAPLPVTAKF